MPRRRNRSKIKRNSRKTESAENTQTISFEGIRYKFLPMPFGSTKISKCECDDHKCEFELQNPPCNECGTESRVLVFTDDWVLARKPITKTTE